MNEPNTTTTDQPQTEPTSGFTPFTSAQQIKIDEIVKDSMRRASKEIRQQLEQEKQERARLQADLESAQSALASAMNSEERDQLRQQVEALSVEVNTERQSRKDAEQHALAMRKKAFITDACLDHNFLDAESVNSLVEQQLDWSEEKQSFVVVGAADITPAEFFSDFAAKKPYMVKSDVRNGSGSVASTRTGLSTGQQRYKVEELFGRGSNSQLANKLALESPSEYKRLRAEAKQKQLI